MGPAGPTTPQTETPAAKPKDAEINVVLVADIDMLHREFFMLREQGDNPEAGIDFNFDNVTFVLNTLDTLAGDTRFVEIRKRRPQHRTLVRIDQYVEEARQETAKLRESLQKKFAAAQSNMEQDLNKQMDKLREDMKKEKIDEQEIMHRVTLALKDGQRKMQTQVDQLQQDQDREIKRIETKQALEIRGVQDRYKLWAVLLPPIPPLLVGLAVLITRRKREREGVARSRLR